MSAEIEHLPFIRGPLSRAVAAFLVGALAAPPAWAAAPRVEVPAKPVGPPSIAVVAMGADDASAWAAAHLSFLGERAVGQVGRQVLTPLASLLDPAADKIRASKAAEGKAAYDAARKLYDDLEI
ncbi:MAG: hypothetical protein HY901_38640, partial [Deltaproteobacteria bacterium]|nr:hypothetical protein [Deltaproteobacteria bacterium]